MTKNTNIKIKFQQKRKTKNIPALLRAGQNLVSFASHVELTWRTHSHASQDHLLQQSTRAGVTSARAFLVKYLQSNGQTSIHFFFFF